MTRINSGFTLIELSIVLVIIGLIVGGVLVGQDLINAAAIRAQVTQIEKYNTAVNTFRGKYGDQLPGDISDPSATQFGFYPRGWQGVAGNGDGNGIIQSWGGTGINQGNGENAMFWVDLSTARLIDGGFNSYTAFNNVGPTVSGSQVGLYFPSAKIGNGNYVYVWSGGINGNDNTNYFGVQTIVNTGNGRIDGSPNLYLGSGASCPGWATCTPYGMSVAQAFAIDTKMDDGLPTTGKVLAIAYNSVEGVMWASDLNGLVGWWAGGSATCFDNGNVQNATYKYSMETQSGSNLNCALSFKFQ